MKKYVVNTYCGCINDKYGVSIAVMLHDPEDQKPGNAAEILAEWCGCDKDDPNFNFEVSSTFVPESLVKRIQEDTMREYFGGVDL